MTFVKKFKEGDHVQTNYQYEEWVSSNFFYKSHSKAGVVVNEYNIEQPLYENGIIVSKKSGKFFHLVEFKDSAGFKHTLNSVYLEKNKLKKNYL